MVSRVRISDVTQISDLSGRGECFTKRLPPDMFQFPPLVRAGGGRFKMNLLLGEEGRERERSWRCQDCPQSRTTTDRAVMSGGTAGVLVLELMR